MSSSAPNSPDAFAVTVAIEIDRVCTAFDRALRRGENPKVEDYLAGVPGPARERILAGLLALEMDYRVARGESPSLTEYRARFPDDARLAKSVFVQAIVPAKIGRFKVDGILGKGGFGRVYLAYDETLKRQVAIKILLGRDDQSESTFTCSSRKHAWPPG